MATAITRCVITVVLSLTVFINTIGNHIGIGDIIETQPPTTTTTTSATTETREANTLYSYNSEGNYYYVNDKVFWEKNASYNDVYDYMAPVAAMFIDQVRICFNYEGKDWMIQMWKGQYGFLLVGSEIGVFTAPENAGAENDVSKYTCADKEDWLSIQHEAYWNKELAGDYEKIFTREYGKYWWTNGYVKGQLTKYAGPKTELKTSSTITFKTEEMADLFVKGLDTAGFAKADSCENLADDTYFQNGADVYINWLTVHQNVNVSN